jgi:ferredoxin
MVGAGERGRDPRHPPRAPQPAVSLEATGGRETTGLYGETRELSTGKVVKHQMMRVDQALCAGCGVCIDECPTDAISLSDGVALIDAALCDGCGACVEVCPNQALAWIAEPMPATAGEASALTVIRPPVEVIRADTRAPVPWRRAILPAVGGALSWMGREIVPRLAPVALDALDSALDRRLSRWSRDESAVPVAPRERQGRGKQRRRRHRRGKE